MEYITLSHITELDSKKTINEMDKYYEKNKVNPPPGAIFRAKTNYATITAYKSGKVLFQGKQPLVESEKLQAEDKSEQTSLFTAAKPSTQSPPKTVFKNSHIGSDMAIFKYSFRWRLG